MSHHRLLRFPERRKYRVADGIFETLTPALAYVLGFIYADGHIFKHQKLGLCNTDEVLLKKILTELGSNQPLVRQRQKKPHHTPCFTVSIHDIELVTRLTSNYGLTQRKSLTCRVPKIPSNMFAHFLRGYFDGDGHVVYHHRRGLTMGFTCGSPLFLLEITRLIKKHLGISCPVPYKKANNKASVIWYYGTTAAEIGGFMYADCGDLFMIRKRDKFAQYENRSNKTVEHQITCKGQTHNIGQWSRITGINMRTLFARIRRGWSHEHAISTIRGSRWKLTV